MKWFKHDTDANMDAKLQEVMLDYGLEGYGLYWYCIELIAQNVNGDNLTFELEHDARIIARNTGSTAQKVDQMMTSFINLGLLNADNGHIFCLKLAARCDDFTAKAVRRNGIKVITNQSVGVSPTNSEKVPLEEEVRSKKKKKEVEVEVEVEVINTLCEEAFQIFYSAGLPKKNPQGARKKFLSLIKKMKCDQKDLAKTLKKDIEYRLSTNEFGFNKLHPATYLNNERWLDEYETAKPGNNEYAQGDRKLSASERIRASNELKYGSQQPGGGLGVATDGRDIRESVGQGEWREAIPHVEDRS